MDEAELTHDAGHAGIGTGRVMTNSKPMEASKPMTSERRQSRSALAGALTVIGIALLIGCTQTPPPDQKKQPAPPPANTSKRTPRQVVEEFRLALRTDQVSTALFMLDDVPFGTPTADHVRSRIKKLAANMARGGYDFRILEAQPLDDCAVVLVVDNQKRGEQIEVDAIYLIQRKEGWKLSPELTKWRNILGLDGKQVARFEQLEKWHQLQKAEWKVKLRNENAP